MPTRTKTAPVRAVTRGPRHHFFGYYDKSPWDASGRYMLALETAFGDREPTADDVATVGIIDLESDRAFHPLAETRAWNWQQGTMLQWLPNAPDRLIVFNDRQDDRFVSVVLDIHTGKRRLLPRPVYALTHDGARTVTPNFARLADLRPGYGYAGIVDPWRDVAEPGDDGIYVMDLETGVSRLIISIHRIAHHQREPRMEGQHHWFNHLQFNTDDSRFVFLHRWPRERGGRYTRMFTAAPDGSAAYCLSDHDMISHFDWRNARQILAYATRREIGDRYFLFDDGTTHFEVVAEGVLTTDGHCSYSPDGRWILTDTYPDKDHMRTLILYRPQDNLRVDIGRFFAPPELPTPARCDLHPRWGRDGKQVCIDSAHEGTRQMYVLEVGEVVEGA